MNSDSEREDLFVIWSDLRMSVLPNLDTRKMQEKEYNNNVRPHIRECFGLCVVGDSFSIHAIYRWHVNHNSWMLDYAITD